MKIRTSFGLLAIIYCLLSTPAYSLCSGCELIVSENRTRGTVVYQDNSFGRVAISGYDDKFREITSAYFDLQQKETKLANELEAMTRQAIYGEASLQKFDFALNGAYELHVDGRSNGIAEIRVGGFRANLNIEVKKSWLAEGSIKVNTSPIWLIGDYSIYSGQILNLRMSPDFAYYTSVDVDTPFDFIPLFNSQITNNFEDMLEDEIQDGIYTALNDTLSSQEIALFGLDQKVEDNVYVYNGRDFGRELKEHLANLFEGESLSIKIDSKTYTGGGFNKTLGNVEVRLSNNIFVRFIDMPKLAEVKRVSASFGGPGSFTKEQARAQFISRYPNVDVNTIQVGCTYQSYGAPVMCNATGYEVYGYQEINLYQSATQHGLPIDVKRRAIDALLTSNPDIINSSIRTVCNYNNYGAPMTCSATGYLNRIFDYTPAN